MQLSINLGALLLKLSLEERKLLITTPANYRELIYSKQTLALNAPPYSGILLNMSQRKGKISSLNK